MICIFECHSLALQDRERSGFPAPVIDVAEKGKLAGKGLSQMRRTGADSFTSGRNGSERVATHVLR